MKTEKEVEKVLPTCSRQAGTADNMSAAHRLSVRLGLLARDAFVAAFRKLRSLPLPEAYELALASGVIEPQFKAYHTARHAAIQRLGVRDETIDGWRIPENDPAKLAEFSQVMRELGDKEIELPFTRKVKFPRDAAGFSADEILALLDTIAE